MYRRFRSSLTPSASPGFTAVELTVAVAISILMVGVIVSFILGVTDQFAVSTVRGQMNVQLTSATNRIENDMQYSRLILAENSVTDSAAPSNDNRWNSGPNQLVLGATARNNANEPLSADYTTSLDNYIYYLNSGTLYRRVLAFSDSNNRYTTSTCAQTLNGGCPTDTAILRNIDSLEFTYYDNSGAETSDYAQASSIKVAIVTKTKQSRHEIELKGGSTFRLVSYVSGSTVGPEPDPGSEPEPEPAIPSLPAAVTAGYGGLTLTNSAKIINTQQNITSYSSISLASAANISVKNIMVANKGCGTGASYGSNCPGSPAPISVAASTLSSQTICGPSLPVASAPGGYGIITGTQTTSCTLPVSLPEINKQALLDTIPTGNTSSAVSCTYGNVSLQANRRYNGNVTLTFCNGTITGSGILHITGDLTVQASTLSQPNSSTNPVTIIVNGVVNIDLSNGVTANGSSPLINIVSFKSSNNACSASSSCHTLSASDLYNSRNVNAIIIQGNTNVKANLYAPFAKIYINNDSLTSQTIYGQTIEVKYGPVSPVS